MKKEVKIFNSSIQYCIDYRSVKYPRLEFRTGMLNIILPYDYENEHNLLNIHKNWIIKKQRAINFALNKSKDKQLINRNLNNLKKIVLDYYNKNSNNFKAKKIQFRHMKSKWGSCSSDKVLTFNSLLRFLPLNLIQYVVYHEMLHLKEKKHNKTFWNIISKKFTNYPLKEKDLFIYWFLIQKNYNLNFSLKL
ncbi:MAG: M48 family metallopeptidase [Candidatus Nanoarchaeia archaeon]